MRKKRRKMVNLSIEETSGVDHPAHLSEGWVVMKNASRESVLNALSGIEESSMTETAPEVEEVAELQDALLAAEARVQELEKAMYDSDDMDEDEKAKKGKKRKAKMEDDELDEELDKEMDEEDEELMKSVPEPVRKMMDKWRSEAKQASEELRKERIAKADADAIARVQAWQSLSLDAEKIGPALRKLSEADADLAKSVEEVLSSVNGQAESANIFAEIGNSNASTGTSAYERLSSMAKAAVEDGQANTFEQAFVEVATKNPEIYAQHLAEVR